jgi:hypothetical protein
VQILSTEEGIQIVESDEQSENAKPSMHESLELDSNVTGERERYSPKQYAQIFSTAEGIQMACRATSPLATSASQPISVT